MKIEQFDIAHHLDNPKVIIYYLVEALKTCNIKIIVRAIGNVVRAIKLHLI